MKSSMFCFVLFLSGAASAENQEWRLVHREDGCIHFSEVDEFGLEVMKAQNPDEFVSALKKKYPDAKKRVFLDAISGDEDLPKSEQEKKMFKLITRKNAFLISFDKGNFEFPVWTKDLCDQTTDLGRQNKSK